MAIRFAVALALCAAGSLCVGSTLALAQNTIGLVGMHIIAKKSSAGTTKKPSRYVAGASGGAWKQSAKPRTTGRKATARGILIGTPAVRPAEF
jgi:hypothetical protein